MERVGGDTLTNVTHAVRVSEGCYLSAGTGETALQAVWKSVIDP